MKKALAVIGETILLLLVALPTALIPRPKHITIILARTETAIRQFDVDWVLAVLAVAALIAVIAVAAKRLRTWGTPLAIAVVLTFLIGFAMKLGFRTTDIPVY